MYVCIKLKDMKLMITLAFMDTYTEFYFEMDLTVLKNVFNIDLSD